MILTFEQIESITSGAAKIFYKDGKYQFFRFTDHETEVIDNTNIPATAGIQLKFKTDAEILKLKVHIRKTSQITSYFCFDIFVNDILAGSIQNLSDEDRKGSYARKEYPVGDYCGEFELGDGEKLIKIVFPHSVIALIEEVELEDATYLVPVKNGKTIIFYGDSITQGYDSLHPAKSYANLLADALDAEVFNKALGGALFDPAIVEASEQANPDYVVAAFGTNDWNSVDLDTFQRNANGFLQAIQKKYPTVPKYILTPLWRVDWQTTKRCGEFSVLEAVIRGIFENQENITVISGVDLIPHNENLFGDLIVHPNDEGFTYYFRNLLKYFL